MNKLESYLYIMYTVNKDELKIFKNDGSIIIFNIVMSIASYKIWHANLVNLLQE